MFSINKRSLFILVEFRVQYNIVTDLNNKVVDIASGGGLVMMPRQPGKTSQLWYFDANGFLRLAVNDYGVGLYSLMVWNVLLRVMKFINFLTPDEFSKYLTNENLKA